MRRDEALLGDIVLAARRIGEHIAGLSHDAFLTDRKTQAAVEREITILGEAANDLSDDLRAAHPEVPWQRLVRLRHFYIHAYEMVDANQVWATACRSVPEFLKAVEPLLPKAPPD
jgi:uncharacterized protein with HEPN domain